ncbi:MAG: hypothetical protein J2P27_09285 [Actinobacteria bacterium]|nr:hypothetical protein [Actinomycetota bacterium]
MPSSWHDAVVEIIRADPGSALQIAREWAGADLPAGLAARLESEGFNDRPSADFAADVVVSAGPAGEPSHAVIVEPQQQQTADKLVQWPRYATAAWLMLRCPVHVLVICRMQAVAEFYDRPIPTTLPGWTLRPVVIGPAQIPALTDPDAIAKSPGLAALSVAVHGRRRAMAEAFAAGIRNLPADQGSNYYEKAHRLSGPQIRAILEEIMTTSEWTVSTPFAKEHFGRGEAKGEANAIMLVLQARGLPVTAEQEARITGCTDLDQLNRWVASAVVVETTAELFD